MMKHTSTFGNCWLISESHLFTITPLSSENFVIEYDTASGIMASVLFFIIKGETNKPALCFLVSAML